jgi:hypothetical protein
MAVFLQAFSLSLVIHVFGLVEEAGVVHLLFLG